VILGQIILLGASTAAIWKNQTVFSARPVEINVIEASQHNIFVIWPAFDLMHGRKKMMVSLQSKKDRMKQAASVAVLY
jgi:hypothetical protein